MHVHRHTHAHTVVSIASMFIYFSVVKERSVVRPTDSDGRANRNLPGWPGIAKNEAGWDCDIDDKS